MGKPWKMIVIFRINRSGCGLSYYHNVFQKKDVSCSDGWNILDTHTSEHTHTSAETHLHKQADQHTHTHTHKHAFTHSYEHAHTNTHTHTHTHKCNCRNNAVLQERSLVKIWYVLWPEHHWKRNGFMFQQMKHYRAEESPLPFSSPALGLSESLFRWRSLGN